MFKLDGKVALVTGGSRGIGRACALALGAQGALVVINYNRGEAQAQEVAAEISAKGGKAEIVGFDVADGAAVEKAIEDLVKRHGRLDILVANAGIAIDGLLLRLKDEDVDKLFATNVKGALTTARCATRPMMKAKTGRIIFMSSVVAEMGNVGQTAYAASKAAILGAMKSIAREYASPWTHGQRPGHRLGLRLLGQRRSCVCHRAGPSYQRRHVRVIAYAPVPSFDAGHILRFPPNIFC
jgi:3-oxoacyl-[acyl-carrier protein] reductase